MTWPAPSTVTLDSSEALARRLREALILLFGEVVDHPDRVVVHASVETYVDRSKVRFASPYGIRLTIVVPDSDIRQAKGANMSIQNAASSWIAAVRGKNRTPIDLEIVAAATFQERR